MQVPSSFPGKSEFCFSLKYMPLAPFFWFPHVRNDSPIGDVAGVYFSTCVYTRVADSQSCNLPHLPRSTGRLLRLKIFFYSLACQGPDVSLNCGMFWEWPVTSFGVCGLVYLSSFFFPSVFQRFVCVWVCNGLHIRMSLCALMVVAVVCGAFLYFVLHLVFSV